MVTATQTRLTETSDAISTPSWRDELKAVNGAALEVRLAFLVLAALTLLPLVSPGVALMAGMGRSHSRPAIPIR